ncbi:MAG: hypothetical protein ACLTDS_04670 [Bianqueaceae bacterium]
MAKDRKRAASRGKVVLDMKDHRWDFPSGCGIEYFLEPHGIITGSHGHRIS